MKRFVYAIAFAAILFFSSSCEEVNMDGGWYHILVPDKGKSNTVIITVDPHDDTKPRQATIEMQAGNAFTKFTISQQ